MPRGYKLTPPERSRLYQKLIQDYFAIDEGNPGILKGWLLGKRREGFWSFSDVKATPIKHAEAR
jgi:hypothetical protein